jgi:L-cysteine S-thiosulfotransferase
MKIALSLAILGIVAASAFIGAGTRPAIADDLVGYQIVDGIRIPQPLTGEPGDPARGRAVVAHRQQGNCLACHQIPALADEPLHGTVGPSLAGVARRYDEGELRLRLVDSKQINPDSVMPAFYQRDGLYRVAPEFADQTILTAQQVEDVLAFLLTFDEEEAPALAAPEREQFRLAAIDAPAGNPYPWLVSGYYAHGEEVRAIQDDDAKNPGMLWVAEGEALWGAVEGEAGKACVSCHGSAADSMQGVGARYPVYDEPSGKLISIEQRINRCRADNMQAPPWGWLSDELAAMTMFVRHQSRGMPVEVAIDGPARPFFEKGKEFYYQRRGLFDMSCASCHEQNYGAYLRGNLLSQGHTNGHPVYFLAGGIDLVPVLFEFCNQRVRSEPYAYGSDEYVNLELYVAWRGQGLPVETPGMRY